jgi:S1-C subfamily serine protease
MWLVFDSGGDEGRSARAGGERFVIGRDPASDLVVNDERASRQHAYLRVYADGRAELHDMNSANGTFVNGHKLTGPVLLQGGEMIQVGETLLRASLTEPSSKATQIGVVPQDLDGPAVRSSGPDSSIERVKLKRSVRVATGVGAAAILGVAALGTLFATGVLGGDDEDPPPPPAELTTAQIVERVTPSTVQILARTEDSGAGGTGWVLDAQQGLIVTNQHVINEGETFEVVVQGTPRPASLVGTAPCDDIAVLRVADTSNLVTLPLANQGDLRAGDEVVAVGFPGTASQQSQLTVNTGVISVVRTTYDEENGVDVPNYPNVIQTDTAINPGNSGGPLVDRQGRLVGVNSAGVTSRRGRIIQGQNYAVGVDRVKELIPDLTAGRSQFWVGIGLDYVPEPPSTSSITQPGFLVDNIVPGSPASNGFPKPGYVVAINGQGLDGTLRSYCSTIRNGPSDAATFSVISSPGAPPQDLRVPFATSPPA